MTRPPLARMVDLPEGLALSLLASATAGRLVVPAEGLPAVEVLGHLLDARDLIVRLRLLHDQADRADYPDRLAYRVEHIDADDLTGWAVTAVGLADVLADPVEQTRYRVPMRAWPDGRHEHLVRIRVDSAHGHHLVRGRPQ